MDCRDSLGGALNIHFIERANVTAITQSAGIITGITKATGKRFWRYTPARDTAYGKYTLTSNVQNGTKFYAQEVSMALNKMQTNTLLELDRLAANSLYAVVTDANKKHWLYGLNNGIDATGGEGGSGTAPGDRNGQTIIFAGSEPLPPIEVDDATYATLETPGT